MTTTQYIIVPHGIEFFRAWAVIDTVTGFVVKSGFITRQKALDFIQTLVPPEEN
jgi:hypothetical protein